MPLLFSVPGINYNCHGSLVDKGDVHHGPEAAPANRLAQSGRQGFTEIQVKWLRLFRSRSTDKGGAVTFSGAGMKSKLADHNYAPACIEEGAIHTAFPVIENPHVGDLGREPLDVCIIIGFFNSEEDEEAGVDGGSNFLLDGDRCPGNPLNDGAHTRSFSFMPGVSSHLHPKTPGSRQGG